MSLLSKLVQRLLHGPRNAISAWNLRRYINKKRRENAKNKTP